MANKETLHISDDRKLEIADQFEDLLEDGKDTDEAGETIGSKYGLTRDQIHEIVREVRKKLEAEDR
jgi:hypothetical protein